MQPASEKCSYLEELSCKEKSCKESQFCFNQNQDNGTLQKVKRMTLALHSYLRHFHERQFESLNIILSKMLK